MQTSFVETLDGISTAPVQKEFGSTKKPAKRPGLTLPTLDHAEPCKAMRALSKGLLWLRSGKADVSAQTCPLDGIALELVDFAVHGQLLFNQETWGRFAFFNGASPLDAQAAVNLCRLALDVLEYDIEQSRLAELYNLEVEAGKLRKAGKAIAKATR